MKHAILITAYKDIDSLMNLVNILGEEFNFYIHIDKKSKIDSSVLGNTSNVFISRYYKVNWGGVNHLKAILLLSKESLKNTDNSYFHLITGEDFPLKSREIILKMDTSNNFLEYFPMPADCWSGNGGMDRINYYQLFDVLDAKNNRQRTYIEKLVRVQKRLGIKRTYSQKLPPKLFGGSTYWSLNREALGYVVNYPNNGFLKRLKYTFCAEEIYFQTILLNSIIANTVINDNLRYIDWTSGKGGYPAYLDETDFDHIVGSDKYFVRKIRSKSKLKHMLLANLGI